MKNTDPVSERWIPDDVQPAVKISKRENYKRVFIPYDTIISKWNDNSKPICMKPTDQITKKISDFAETWGFDKQAAERIEEVFQDIVIECFEKGYTLAFPDTLYFAHRIIVKEGVEVPQIRHELQKHKAFKAKMKQVNLFLHERRLQTDPDYVKNHKLIKNEVLGDLTNIPYYKRSKDEKIKLFEASKNLQQTGG